MKYKYQLFLSGGLKPYNIHLFLKSVSSLSGPIDIHNECKNDSPLEDSNNNCKCFCPEFDNIVKDIERLRK